MRKPRRRTVGIALALMAAGSLALAFALPRLAVPLVESKLQAIIAEQLNARLSLTSLEYLPPYGVRVRGARLVATDPAGRPFDLLTADRIELTLARCPLLPGPLVIGRLTIASPALHVIQTDAGLVGRGLARQDVPAATRKQKLSEIFELRHVSLSDAQLVYDDRTLAGSVPLAWRNLRLDMETAPQSAARYHFDVRAGDGATATLAAAGAFDIDSLTARLEACDVRVAIDAAAAATESPLPAIVQQLVRADRISGSAAIAIGGELTLGDPRRSRLTATIDLSHAIGRLPGAAEPLDELTARLTCRADPATLQLQVDQVVARRGDSRIDISAPSATLDVQTAAVAVKDFTVRLTPGRDRSAWPASIVDALESTQIDGTLTCVVNGSATLGGGPSACRAAATFTPDRLRVQSPALPDALHDFAPFTLDVRDGARVQAMRAAYGNDVFFVRDARLPLAGLPGRVRFDALAGCITFDARRATYPPAIESYLLDAEPRGPFFFDGEATADFGPASADFAPGSTTRPAVDYRVRVTSDRATLSPLRRHVPLLNVASDLLVTPRRVTIDRFDAAALAGQVGATGTIRVDGDAIAYAAAVRLRRIDLNELASLATADGAKPLTIAGELNADVTLAGAGVDAGALAALRADGAVQIERGDLFHIPTLAAITDRMGLHSATTLGEASATFALADGVVRLTDAAIGSPAVGVHGSGTVGLVDHRLDLQVIAAPLNDWEKSLRRGDDNAVANVAANIAGSVQGAINRVTAAYLYQVHVGGTTDQPEVQVVAAPALRGAAK